MQDFNLSGMLCGCLLIFRRKGGRHKKRLTYVYSKTILKIERQGGDIMNVFRKENRRRILFTLTLTLLAAVLSFGFVSRAVEYLAVRQELERLSDHYRTIG